MNNTALRAEVQSATSHKESVVYGDHPYDITHMVFANEEHEKFYCEKLKQARYQDCYHEALIYILGMSGTKHIWGWNCFRRECGEFMWIDGILFAKRA